MKCCSGVVSFGDVMDTVLADRFAEIGRLFGTSVVVHGTGNFPVCTWGFSR